MSTMLYDKARIFVQAGGGGDGCLSFRREAHVPRGGPDGGDGGRGGDVVLLCDDSLRDLQSFKRRAHYKARRGRHGEGSQRHGADGADLVVRVPPGTQARTARAAATSSWRTSSGRGCSATCSTSRRWTARTRGRTGGRLRTSSSCTTRGSRPFRACSRCPRPTLSRPRRQRRPRRSGGRG